MFATNAEETKVVEVTDQQVESARYGRSARYGHRYGRSVADHGQESHYGGYYPRYGVYHYSGYYHH